MSTPADTICAASVPASALESLAGLRRESGIGVILAGDRAWLCWEPGTGIPQGRLMALPGVEPYEHRDGHWYRFGPRLPSFGLPLNDGEPLPLHRVLVPLPIEPLPPASAPVKAALLRLVCE